MVTMIGEKLFYQKLNSNQFALDGVKLLKGLMQERVIFGFNLYIDGFKIGDIIHSCRKYGYPDMNSWQMQTFGKWIAKQISDEYRKYKVISVDDESPHTYGLGSGGNVVYSGTSTYHLRVCLEGYYKEYNAYYAWHPVSKKYHWFDEKTGREIADPRKPRPTKRW